MQGSPIGVDTLTFGVGTKNPNRGDFGQGLVAGFTAAQLFLGPLLGGDIGVSAEVTVKLTLRSQNRRAKDHHLPSSAALAENFYFVTGGHSVAALVLFAHNGFPAVGGEKGLVILPHEAIHSVNLEHGAEGRVRVDRLSAGADLEDAHADIFRDGPIALLAFAEDLLELPALDFGGGATGKNAQQGFDGAIFIQWAAIKGGHQTEGTAGGVKERCAHVTLGGQLHQHPVLWKFPLNPSWIATQLLIDYRFTRRAGQTVFEIVNNLLVGRDR